MYQTTRELRTALPEGVACLRVTARTAWAHTQQATAYWAECESCGQVAGSENFTSFATENGWCTEPGWWWAEYELEEQQHGPFASERECLVHCLTWQHVLVNGKLNGHLPHGQVWAPGFTHVVKG